ncbi:MAG: hypothetical protein IPN46_20025 [Saprospiraceae bacterium]|nr:hypothetical protein [Saprospiraceae bacterium]
MNILEKVSIGDSCFSKEGALDSIPPIDTLGTKIDLAIKTNKPKGKIAFKNANIITMENDKVIKNGIVLVDENIIKYVGPASGINLDKSTKIIDVNGKYTKMAIS